MGGSGTASWSFDINIQIGLRVGAPFEIQGLSPHILPTKLTLPDNCSFLVLFETPADSKSFRIIDVSDRFEMLAPPQTRRSTLSLALTWKTAKTRDCSVLQDQLYKICEKRTYP